MEACPAVSYSPTAVRGTASRKGRPSFKVLRFAFLVVQQVQVRRTKDFGVTGIPSVGGMLSRGWRRLGSDECLGRQSTESVSIAGELGERATAQRASQSGSTRVR